jgi:hypothetical protein
MRLTIEIIATAILVFCLTATSAAFAAQAQRSADGLSCSFSVASGASLRRDQAAVRWKVLGELLWRQTVVGDVSGVSRACP